jgi:DNA-binding CsgD family transcriptional regulator
MDLPRFNRLLLDLHRTGQEAPLSQFQPAALELIQEIIPFDSAWWGNASVEPLEIHRLHLHNCEASILEIYAPYMAQDFFREALMAHPGQTINMADLTTRARFVRTELYQKVGTRYKIEWSLGTLLVEPVSSLQEFLTLWRHDAKRPFTETERQTKELLMPHLADAHRAARLREVLDNPRRRECWAVADERGFLREINPGFVHCLRSHWPDWQGSRLPEALLVPVRDAHTAHFGQLRMAVTKRGTFRYLLVSGASAIDALSSREREIVAHYASGETYVRIASALGISPATVRNHIAHCYRKLAVRNKAELAQRVLKDAQ